ncbi:MAG: sugar phosphate nucleotidyltransferase [Spirochaetes bacterium]|jgi:mannose-1-phosphate guanylyltransferase/phosphomannomutase|nr:sugar phosphate nucleotidyltransferase [Spirochaetota bacterium]
MIKAVIMAGGEGTRLRPLTSNRAKPMTPVVNKPVIEHAVELLRAHGIRDIIISLFYLPENIQNYFGDGADWDVSISYSVEETPLGTAGGVRLASDGFDDTFVVLSGDGIIDFNITEILNYHKNKNSDFTIALKRVEEPTEYGIVITDTTTGKISKFLEKPSWSEVFSDTANSGMYVIEPHLINHFVPVGKTFDFSIDLFPLLQNQDVNLYGYITDGYWCDVGNIDSFLAVHRDILEQLVDIQIPGKMIADRVWIGKNVEIEPGVRLKGPIVIGDFVKIKKGAEISDFSVIGNNCVIEEGASVRRSVVLHSTIIGPNAELRGAIVGKRCFLEENVSIYERAIISDDCHICANAEIPASIRVWPDKVIEEGTRLTTDLIWGRSEKKLLFNDSKIIGSFNVKITPEFSAKLGSALGAWLGRNTRVTISRDASGASRLIKRAITSGLLSMGVDVFDLEIESLPVTRYASRFIKTDLAINVETRPQTGLQYIVIHIFNKDGFQLLLGTEKKIESIFYRGDYPRKSAYEVGQLHYSTHHIESYVDYASNYIDYSLFRGSKLSVIVDCSNGAASYIFPDILSFFGIVPTTLRGQIQYRDIERDKIAESAKGVDVLQVMCVSNREIGVMISSTGSRIDIYDERGLLLSDDEIIMLLCIFYAKYKRAGVFRLPVTATRKLDAIVQEYGATVERISTKIRSPEKSTQIYTDTGEGIYPTLIVEYDVMICFLMILELILREKTTLSDIRRTLPEINELHRKIECTHQEKALIMRKMTEVATEDLLELTDGVRIVRSGCWILVLPDGSQPFIHLYAEGDTDELRDEILTEYTRKIKSLRKTGNGNVHNQ